jgi:hypothetical protein
MQYETEDENPGLVLESRFCEIMRGSPAIV